jgi:AsmA protein
MIGVLRSKAFKISLVAMGFVLLFLAVFPLFFKDKLKAVLEKTLQEQVLTELRFEEVNLSFFRHFPSLTLSMDQLYLGGSLPFESDTLLYAHEMGFGVDIPSLFTDQVKITEVYLNQATIKVHRDVRGNSNFDIFPATDSDTSLDESGAFAMEIEEFYFRGSRFFYEDTSVDMILEADGIDYRGSGNLAEGLFALESKIEIGQIEMMYGEFPIFNRNRLAADLLTRIDTETTALTFERNALKINDLPLNFVGAFEFIPGGYDMNFILESFDANLKDIFSLVPPEFMPGFEQTKFAGKGDIIGSFQGLYLPEENEFPGLVLSLRLDQGMISHTSSAPGVENLTARVNFRIPQLDLNQVILDIDSLAFDLGEGYLRGGFHLENLHPMRLDSDLDAKLNLAQLNAAIGMAGLDYRGQLELFLHSKGNFHYAIDPHVLRSPKATIQSIPSFTFSAKLEGGYLQWAGLPEPIKDLEFVINADVPDSLIKHINFELKGLNFQVLDQVTTGFVSYLGRDGRKVEANVTSNFDFADIPKFYPLDSGFQLAGKLALDLQASGQYLPENKTLPKFTADLAFREGSILTPFHPEAIRNISCILTMENTSTSYSDLKFEVQPISFEFAGQPFLLKANLEDLDDIKYDVESQGTLELGKLYRVFGVEGVDLEGQLIADLRLKGRQSDAAAGRIRQLNNEGTMQIEKVQVRTELLPEPIHLDKGVLTFNQDKIEFENFLFGYSKNKFTASGKFTNYLGYLADENETLGGTVEFKSDFVDLDDFVFFSEEDPGKVDSLGLVSGVIVPPSNLNLKITAAVDSLHFGEYFISDFHGQVATTPGEIILDQTEFQLVGATVGMKGAYRAPSPYTAYFDYQIKARDFDIQKAYQDLTIFREMVTFAEFAEGKASLDYKLSGRLDANMAPVFPSIQGEGTLGLKSIKLKGFKLMNAMAEKTENEELHDPELNDIEIKTSIKDNLITIPRTRMKIAGFRPRLEGQVSLDGDLNVGVRLGLPPLGIFGIPVKITGNAENYLMKVGKSTKEDDLEASFDEQAQTQESNPTL